MDMPIQCLQIPAEGTTRHGGNKPTAEASCSESKGNVAIPGSPDRTSELHIRLIKVEKDLLTVKTRIACERASWERRFWELQKRQEELNNQAGGLMAMGGCDDQGESGDNGEVFEDCLSGFSTVRNRCRGSEVALRDGCCASTLPGCQLPSASTLSPSTASSLSSVTSVRSWRTSKRPYRVFVPHSPMDLEVGHRVRIMLPSGRISTGTVRFLGHLQGEPELHLGVELQRPDHGLHDGNHGGYHYFECKPGYGAFVPFHKLLMAWE
ncbi:uncharacterized protein [Antennarius striatus]|uniref:uncharacterized protein isoform X2 n=1 Tax=Antennarius striatus TaxID=241820 RepID=UPI0035AD8FBF